MLIKGMPTANWELETVHENPKPWRRYRSQQSLRCFQPTILIMPTRSDKEIIALFKAIEQGDVEWTFGSPQVIERVEPLQKRCKDTHYKRGFHTWWCKERQKALATTALEPGRGFQKSSRPATAVPPETAKEASGKQQAYAPKTVADKDQPPAKKPPKKKVQNQPYVSPAPSPEPEEAEKAETEGEVAYNFESELFKKKSSPLPSPEPKPSPEKPKLTSPKKASPKSDTKQTPEKQPPTSPDIDSPASIMSQHMLPDDIARQLIEKAKVALSTFPLKEDGPHGIEMYKVPHPCRETGIMCITYIIKGAKEAEIMEGGKQVHVRFERGVTGLPSIIQHMRNNVFSAKLTNGAVNSEFSKFEDMANHMVQTKTSPHFVSLQCVFAELSAYSNIVYLFRTANRYH